jgi:hypothetical protein
MKVTHPHFRVEFPASRMGKKHRDLIPTLGTMGRVSMSNPWETVIRNTSEKNFEIVRLAEALKRAHDHLLFNTWHSDPGNVRRNRAVEDAHQVLEEHERNMVK